ncbi:unnamed protein product [Caenorhabditis nigoni]
MDNPEKSMILQVLENYPIAKKIIDACDLPSIVSLKKTNSAFRNLIREQNPKFPIQKIGFSVKANEVNLEIRLNQDEVPYPDGGFLNIKYQESGHDCLIRVGETSRLVSGISMEHVFCADFLSIFNFQSCALECLEVTSNCTGEDEQHFAKIMVPLNKQMEEIPDLQIQTDEFRFTGVSDLAVYIIGSRLEPGTLKRYKLFYKGPRDREIAYWRGMRDQWDQLEEFEQVGQNGFGQGFNFDCLALIPKVNMELMWMPSIEKLVKMFLKFGPPKEFNFLCDCKFIEDHYGEPL